MFGMWDFWDEKCSGSGKLGMMYVRDEECVMWDVCQDVGC